MLTCSSDSGIVVIGFFLKGSWCISLHVPVSHSGTFLGPVPLKPLGQGCFLLCNKR